MGARLRKRWLLLVGLPVGEACAGAWTQPPGHNQSINSFSRERGDAGETWRSDSLGEYGFAGNWGGRLRLETQLRPDESADDKLSVEIGVQRAFALGERSSVSISASALAGEALEGPDCRGGGFETRAALGRSFAIPAGNAFVNVEAAFRSRGSACERVVTEAALGGDLGLSFRAIAKVYTETGDRAHSEKAEAMLLYDFGKTSAGLGYRREVSGRFKEEGIVVQVWRRF